MQDMFSMLTTIFFSKLKPINSRFHNRPECFRFPVVNVLRNPYLQLGWIYHWSQNFKYNSTDRSHKDWVMWSWRPGCWKVTADYSIISEVLLEQLWHCLCRVLRSTILHENGSIRTWTLLKCWNNLVVQKTLTTFTIDSTGNTNRETRLFKKQWPKNKRCRQSIPLSYFCRIKRHWYCENGFSFAPYFNFVYW